ncbi:UDP-N-acetylmuramyl-tripeptide synthetase [Candidatus Uhrbacteria bacterium]|nr:UDP-N-acetylmuramyl-tripeptide synthetase [Candidatus Uhrbacteria bacterium]
MIKGFLRKLAPAFAIGAYHYVLAILSAILYGRPSERMVVIGVTGTSGKSTTCYLLARALEACGARVGMASTILFKVGEQERLNDKKMTMVGRFQLQKLLRGMASADCTHAIIETTSEGIKQYRHAGVHYDVCVFTNLYPEHIESHGSFENYRAEKMKLFKKLGACPHKIITGKRIEKAIVVNGEDNGAKQAAIFPVDRLVVVRPSAETDLALRIPGAHMQINAKLARAVAEVLGFDRAKVTRAIESVTCIPGRLEQIDEGQSFMVIVDYAFEPRALAKLYEAVTTIPHNRIIHVTGAAGGGRDRDKRPVVGAFIAQRAQVMIVTNEDPYDEDPEQIINDVAAGADSAPEGKRAEVLKILDRGEAIARALSLAQPRDLVLVTGKASEQAIVVAGGKRIPWDDRVVIREALRKML